MKQHTRHALFEMFEQDRSYLERKFKEQVCDPSSGLTNEVLKAKMMVLADELKGQPHAVIKARAFACVCENMMIDVNSHDWFVAFGCWDRLDRPLSPLVEKWRREIWETPLAAGQLYADQNQSGVSVMWPDFDHSVPDWGAVFTLGFPGLRERARQYRQNQEARGDLTVEAVAYFDGIEITYTAILDLLKRFREKAQEQAVEHPRAAEVAACLKTLIDGPPVTTYDVLQLIYLFFMFGEHIDRYQVRSLGNLDRTVRPYFERDVAEGRYTEAQIRELFAYFLMQWASIDNYWGHPFYFGGTTADGESEINALSYLILDVYDQLAITTPKLQLKIAPNTPTAFIDKALDMIRRGHSSIVFVNEVGMRRAMMGLGYTEEEARTCAISGCYEFIPDGRGNKTAPGYLNLLKSLELVFNNGVDPKSGIVCGVPTGDLDSLTTFDAFYAAYIRQLNHTIETVITCVNDFEQYLDVINPAHVFSATIQNSLRTAKDAFQNGSVYNTTIILNTGLATTVDALMAVKELVYNRREVSLSALGEILKNNWDGHEILRLKALRLSHKFGNGIDEVDWFAESLARFIANKINLRPNARDGFFEASMHSARTFLDFGEKTGATPDGRLAGEEISKNISPTMGMDINGVTALVKSVTRIDSALFPGDFPLDVMLHPATVAGQDGLDAMRTLLKTYVNKNGLAIHFNIFDAAVLLDAQQHPEKYEGLQVRVCGWNVLFNNMVKKEQDAYIKRAMNISE